MLISIMLSIDTIQYTLGTIAAGSFLYYVITRIMTLYNLGLSGLKILQQSQTPLPDFTALVDARQNIQRRNTLEQPKSRIPTKDELKTYCEKYKQYYKPDEVLSPLSNDDIEHSLKIERAKYTAYINKEIDEISEILSAICQKIGQTKQTAEDHIRGLYAAHHPSWLAIYEKYTTKTVTTGDQVNTIMLAFEEYYFEKAHMELATKEEEAPPAPSPLSDDFALDDVYPEDDTTALIAQPPPLSQRVADYIDSNVDFAYIKVYLYNLHIDILRHKIAAIERGENDAVYMEQATTNALCAKYAKLRKNILIEHTPVGNICMYYNSENTSFEYYADVTIPYIILETVARKYCHIYRCRELYIQVQNETVKMYAEDTIAERKLHTYKHSNAANALMTSDKRNADMRARAWGQSSSLKAPEPELKEFKRRINNFVKKSQFADFKALQYVPVAQRFKKMSWADYAKSRHAPARKIHPGMEMHESMASLPDAPSTFGGGLLQ